MMRIDRDHVFSRRSRKLARKFAKRKYRDAYMAQHLRSFLADQIRAIRGERSQKEFGRLIEKPQNVVSRIEDENYGKLSLQTLIGIANKLDVALIVQFVDYPTFLEFGGNPSARNLTPAPYNNKQMEEFIAPLKIESSQSSGDVTILDIPLPTLVVLSQQKHLVVGV